MIEPPGIKRVGGRHAFITTGMTMQVKDDWYKDFFQGINCELWENAIPTDWTDQEIDFIVNELNLQPGGHILDIPCGFGRHSIPLSKKGFTVTGVDISKRFINSLNEAIDAGSLNITSVHADILDVHFTEKFSGAICLGNSFGYFDIERMKLFIQKVAAPLQTGARFIINSGMIAESILPNFSYYAKNKSYTVGDITMEVNNVYHAGDGFMVSNLHYTKAGKTEEHAFRHFVFTLAEVKRLLALSGLQIIATYSSPAKAAFNPGDQQIYIVAVKE